MSVVESSYVTKMSPDEYMNSEDLVEVLRVRFTDSERDRPPDGIDELCERSWSRSFTADDLREETNAAKREMKKIGHAQKVLSHEVKALKMSFTKQLEELNKSLKALRP